MQSLQKACIGRHFAGCGMLDIYLVLAVGSMSAGSTNLSKENILGMVTFYVDGLRTSAMLSAFGITGS